MLYLYFQQGFLQSGLIYPFLFLSKVFTEIIEVAEFRDSVFLGGRLIRASISEGFIRNGEPKGGGELSHVSRDSRQPVS